jgi:HEPN domain-containing protein
VLTNLLENAGQAVPRWLYDNRDLLNKYATTTRYGDNVIGTKRKVEELIGFAEQLLKQLEPEKIDNASAVNSAASNLAHQEAL